MGCILLNISCDGCWVVFVSNYSLSTVLMQTQESLIGWSCSLISVIYWNNYTQGGTKTVTGYNGSKFGNKNTHIKS